jgi:hypothetical protein
MVRVAVMPRVSQVLGQKLKREPLIRVLNRLYSEMGNRYEHYRSRRDPEDETLFDYVVHVADGEDWHTLRFSVDDTTAQETLLVVAVSHRPGRSTF